MSIQLALEYWRSSNEKEPFQPHRCRIAIVASHRVGEAGEERVCFDLYARAFAGAGLYYVMRLSPRWVCRLESPGVGVPGRARSVHRRLPGGLLIRWPAAAGDPGAGYDARAYRFETLKTGSRCSSVDHPATQVSS